MYNREMYLKDQLEEATQRLRDAMLSFKTRKPTMLVAPKSKTMYRVNRALASR